LNETRRLTIADIRIDHVGTAALGCPVERNSTGCWLTGIPSRGAFEPLTSTLFRSTVPNIIPTSARSGGRLNRF